MEIYTALLYELSLLIYLLPPIAGFMFARAKQFSAMQKSFVISGPGAHVLLRICLGNAERARDLRYCDVRCVCPEQAGPEAETRA